MTVEFSIEKFHFDTVSGVMYAAASDLPKVGMYPPEIYLVGNGGRRLLCRKVKTNRDRDGDVGGWEYVTAVAGPITSVIIRND